MKNPLLFFSSLKVKLISSMLVVMLIPIIFISVYVNTQMRKQLTEDSLSSTTKEIVQVDNGLSMYFDTIKENCDYLANIPIVKESDDTITTYMDKSGNVEMTPSINGELEQQIFSTYVDFAKTHPGSSYVYMATENGGYIQFPAGGLMDNYDPRTRPFYMKSEVINGETVITNPYYFAQDDAVNISIVTAITNQAGEFIGVQGLDVSLKGLTDMIEKIKIGQNGYIIMTDGDGTILADPKRPEMNFKHISELGVKEISDLTNIKDTDFSIVMDGIDAYAKVYTSEKTGWKFIAIIDKEEMLEGANKIQVIILILALIFTVFALIISVLLSNTFTNPILQAVAHLTTIQTGDFTREVPKHLLKRRDELGSISRAIEEMQNTLKRLINEIRNSAKTVTQSSNMLLDISKETVNASEEISRSIDQVAQTSEEEAKDIEEGAKRLDELAESIESVSNHNVILDGLINNASEHSSQGTSTVRLLTSKSNEVNTSVEEVNETILVMDGMSGEIGTITETIGIIADQTNLLALNAAIEAARAGENGRGFAVVAEEVRKLAEQSSTSANNIKQLISKIQQQSKTAVEAMSKTREIIREEDKSVIDTEKAFESITEAIAKAANMVKEIRNYSSAMTMKKNNLVDIISNMSAMAQETAASTEEISATTEEQTATIQVFTAKVEDLKLLADKLEDFVHKFKVL